MRRFYENDKLFYEQNIESVNKLTTFILFWTNLLSPLFILFDELGIFQIPFKFIFQIELLVLIFTGIQVLLVFVLKAQKLAMYFGTIMMASIVGFMATNVHVGIYISYGIMIFFTCLYYNPKLTKLITVYCYAIMIFSLYFRGKGAVAENLTTAESPLNYVIKMGSGFTMEYFFVFLLANSISKRYGHVLDNAVDKNKRLLNTQLEIIDFLPKILESHEVFTGHHARHTVKYVEMICNELVKEGLYTDVLTENMIKAYSTAANLHDIGKIHIPDNILNKTGRYTPEEFEMMQSHPAEGKKLIESLPQINFGGFNEIAIQMAYCHHEKFDGTGYPQGLKGEEIPLCARIMAAADVVDALISWRPYKKPFDIDQTMQIIEESKGTHFEPCIAQAVLNLKAEIKYVSDNFKVNEISQEEDEYKWRQRLI